MTKQSGYDRIKRQIDTAEREMANAQGELSEAKKEKNQKRIERAQKAIEENQNKKLKAESQIESAVQFYEVEYDHKSVHLTHEGLGAAPCDAALRLAFLRRHACHPPHSTGHGKDRPAPARLC